MNIHERGKVRPVPERKLENAGKVRGSATNVSGFVPYKSLRDLVRRVYQDSTLSGSQRDRAVKRFMSWMRREAQGSADDYVSPFFGLRGEDGNSRPDAVKRRKSVVADFMGKVLNQALALPENFAKLVITLETSQADAIGAQSPFLKWAEDGPAKVQAVYSDKFWSKDLDERALSRACEKVRSLVTTDSIEMTSIDDAIQADRINPHSINEGGMDVSTSSGLYSLKSPWKPSPLQNQTAREDSTVAFEYILNRASYLLDSFLHGRSVEVWAIVGKRLVQKGPDWRETENVRKGNPLKRKRLIIAIEKAEPIIWKTFTPGLYSVLRKLPQFSALNDLPITDRMMQEFLSDADRLGLTIVSGDYSAYDASLPPKLIQLAGDIIGSWVKGGQTLVSTLTANLISNVNLVVPDGIWFSCPSSMKSGSGGTNILDSICNLIILHYGEEIGKYKIKNCSVQGDDFVVYGEGVNPKAISEVASYFGIEAHPTKQMYEPQALMFCQRLHLLGFLGGIASAVRTLGSIMSYERMSFRPNEWGPYADVVRARSQLENAVFNPFFEDLVNFVKEGDKYQLGGNLSPKDLLVASGQAGLEVLQKSYGAVNKDRSMDATAQFELSAVRGVLSGLVVPPLGSDARFSFAYGTRAA